MDLPPGGVPGAHCFPQPTCPCEVAVGALSMCRIRVATAAIAVLTSVSCAAEPAPPPGAPAPTAATPALPAAADVLTRGAVVIKATPNPDWAVATPGGVWVSGVDPGLKRYDVLTGEPTGEVPIYSVCMAMDHGFESVWAASCSYESPSVLRIDTTTGRTTAEIPMPARLPAESSIGAGEGAVWVLTSGSDRKLVGIDPGSNAITSTFPAPDGATAVRAGLGAIWVTVGGTGNVLRLDPRSGTVAATIAVGQAPHFLAVGADAVWVLNKLDGTVSRIDPRSGTVAATITVSAGPIKGGDIVAAADAVWVRATDVLAVRIDPQTNTVTERLGPPAGSGSLAVADGSLWITAHDTQSVWRVPTAR